MSFEGHLDCFQVLVVSIKLINTDMNVLELTLTFSFFENAPKVM